MAAQAPRCVVSISCLNHCCCVSTSCQLRCIAAAKLRSPAKRSLCHCAVPPLVPLSPIAPGFRLIPDSPCSPAATSAAFHFGKPIELIRNDIQEFARAPPAPL